MLCPLNLTEAAGVDALALTGIFKLISMTVLLTPAQRSCLALTVSTARCEQVEARGNALERLREENEGLTSDYNHLRERLSAKEAEAQAAASAVNDLRRQLATSRSSAGRSLSDQKVLP